MARFEEAMATIRALRNSKGQLVERDSEFFPLRNANGFLPGFGHHPTEYAQRLETVRTAASDTAVNTHSAKGFRSPKSPAPGLGRTDSVPSGRPPPAGVSLDEPVARKTSAPFFITVRCFKLVGKGVVGRFRPLIHLLHIDAECRLI